MSILNSKCPTYQVFEAANVEYFTAIMLTLGEVEVNSSKVIPSPSSKILRALQKIEVTLLQNISNTKCDIKKNESQILSRSNIYQDNVVE